MKKNEKNAFNSWVDEMLSDLKFKEIEAINFNLYENEEDGKFDAQIIGAPSYDSKNDDWACNETFSTGENLFNFNASNWEKALDIFDELIKEYLKNGKYSAALKELKAVAFGFVDGDLIVVYEKT